MENKEIMIIKINENQYNSLFLLVEGAQANNEKAARDYLRSKCRLNDEQALNFIGTIKHDISNSKLAKSKFMLGVVRICYEENIVDTDLPKFNTLLAYIASDSHVNEYDRNLNGLTFGEINERFSTIMLDNMEAEKRELSSMKYNFNSNYTIVPIPTHEDAKKYAQYTTWCVTQDKGLYNTYTYGGIGMFYFCLRNDFMSTPKEIGENCPLDNYGLSMIAVSVTPEGAPNTITCRWNHDNKGSDKVMTPKELSILLGKSFYELFPPKYNEAELRKLGYVPKDEALEILKNGGNPNLCAKTIEYLLKKEDKDIQKYVEYFCCAYDDDGYEHEYSSMYDLANDGWDESYAIESFLILGARQSDRYFNPSYPNEFGVNTPALNVWVKNFYDTRFEGVYIIDTDDGKQNIYCALNSSEPVLKKNADRIIQDSIFSTDKKNQLNSRAIANKLTFVAVYDKKYALFSEEGQQLSDFYSWIKLAYRHSNCPYIVTNFDGTKNLMTTNGDLYFPFSCLNIECQPIPTNDMPGIVEMLDEKWYFVSPDGQKIISKPYDYISENYEHRFWKRKVFNCTVQKNPSRNIYIEYKDGKLFDITSEVRAR